MPYRIDFVQPGGDVGDRLIDLGALDVDLLPGGRLAAVMPDAVPPARVAAALGLREYSTAPAVGRDADSVWVLGPRPIQVGRLRIVPSEGPPSAGLAPAPGVVRLIDGPAFGTGLHPTTALCLEALQHCVEASRPGAVLDVGTGSGILALAALVLGVPRAVGLDIDGEALKAAARNARDNRAGRRLRLVRGGPEAVTGAWPLVLANVLAAPLIGMAPTLVRRIGHGGELVLSGIPSAVAEDVERAYLRLGLARAGVSARGGWTALLMRAPW